ncbi:UvrD-helicase domain-containing protein [Flavobacterium sp. IB48]|uniref:UvrD-helicase domain-containing protein n=1 Tax=Flavobacterium sp. IB48 TaxID=2779375 RepID=UPI0018E878F4|nr:UvrD-helicase domain-containing protein [Flavobacterium sp. IB48]MBJ2123411.1 AAA family ATPase [Flavobacterium sp. IB48]
MIEIQIAGAGAGKTYGLAKKLIDCADLNNSHKIIYAITYTNSARKKISSTILEQLGYIPTEIKIETVHSFFLNEIIYPYSQYAICEMYNNAVSFKLPDDIRWKKGKINKLKERNIIHNEEVFKKAKIIIDRTNSKHSNKAKRAKVDFILSHIESKISHVFIDESQDLDSDALRAFEILGINGIKIYMIGDPKQAIKYPKDFNDFISQCKSNNDEKYAVLEPNNKTIRIPNELLKISNLFCPRGQDQTNIAGKIGIATYLTTNESFYSSVIDGYKKLDKLIYIEKKQANYETHSDSKKIYFPLTLEDKLRNLNGYSHLDPDLFISSLIIELTDKLEKISVYHAMKYFENKYVEFDKYEYAELKQVLTNYLQISSSNYLVSSIDGVKGLESDVCLFILNESMYKYLIKDIPKSNFHNKNWKKLYVALTRSSEKIIFLIDEQLFPNIKISEIEDNLLKLNIKKHELESFHK